MSDSQTLQYLGDFGVAFPELPDEQDTLIDIARQAAIRHGEELEAHQQKQQWLDDRTTRIALQAFNMAHPRLRIVGDTPPSERQMNAFFKFLKKQPPRLTTEQIGAAAIKVNARNNGLALAEARATQGETIAIAKGRDGQAMLVGTKIQEMKENTETHE